MNDRQDRSPAFAKGSDAVSDPSGPQFLVVGRVVKPHGVHGELRVEIHTAYPERFAVYKTLYVGASLTPHRLTGHRFHHDMVLLSLEGIGDRTQAEALRNEWLWISMADAVPLEAGEFYVYQAIGLSVITDEGVELGRIVEIMETGANDVYIVQGAQGEVLLPDIPEVILRVDIGAAIMTVHLLDGLVE